MKSLLAFLARGQTPAELADRPPNFHGSKLNATRRRLNLESWHQSRHLMRKLRNQGFTQQRTDQAHFGRWYDFACGIKREQANADHVAKAQAALQYLRKS